MDRRVRYQVLPEEEEDTPAEPVDITLTSGQEENPQQQNPEPAEIQNSESTGTPADNSGAHKVPVPPSYSIATDLPTYEEAERTKEEEARSGTNTQNDEESQFVQECNTRTDLHLGTDGMFMCTFIVAFLFNWIGLMAALCMTQTVAARFGALAGFGLSLVKWVAIVKHNNWATGVADGDSWLWWMLILLGFLIFFRGCIQYIRLKHQWNRLGPLLRDRIFMDY